METRTWPVARRTTVATLTAVTLLAAALVPAAPAALAAPAGCGSTRDPELWSVAATSASDAWAVGNDEVTTGSNPPVAQSLIEHWNGTTWCVVPSPDPGGPTDPTGLNGVTATSAGNAWAVGHYSGSAGTRTIILHWDGTSWTQVPSPDPSHQRLYNDLFSVSAASASSAWAVGEYTTASHGLQPLIARWNGTTWKQVASPVLPAGGTLHGVAATSTDSAWAAGYSQDPSADLTEQTNGTGWTQVTAPDPVTGTNPVNETGPAAASSPANVWVIGSGFSTSDTNGTLFGLHWTGTGGGWTVTPMPDPDYHPSLSGVATLSTSSAWAVGTVQNSEGALRTLILRWNGTAWTRTASPDPGNAGTDDQLTAVAAVSASDAWAVGMSNGTTLMLHWDGAAWGQVSSP